MRIRCLFDPSCMRLHARRPLHRFLHILLFNAERAWSYAMQLKKEVEQSMSLRKRSHLVRRMDKARAWAEELAKLSAECCDARGQLECQAYAAWLHGCMLLEKARALSHCLTNA